MPCDLRNLTLSLQYDNYLILLCKPADLATDKLIYFTNRTQTESEKVYYFVNLSVTDELVSFFEPTVFTDPFQNLTHISMNLSSININVRVWRCESNKQ